MATNMSTKSTLMHNHPITQIQAQTYRPAFVSTSVNSLKHQFPFRRIARNIEFVSYIIPPINKFQTRIRKQCKEGQFDFCTAKLVFIISTDCNPLQNIPATARNLPGQAHLPSPNDRCPGSVVEAVFCFSTHRIPSNLFGSPSL